mgnify:CR=1 FL=1
MKFGSENPIKKIIQPSKEIDNKIPNAFVKNLKSIIFKSYRNKITKEIDNLSNKSKEYGQKGSL